MIDFMLTKTGDIVLSENTRKKSTRELFFKIADSSINISFYIDDDSSKQKKNGINISFDVEKENNYESNDFKVLSSNLAKKQMIKNAICTTKKELAIMTEFGSRMEEVKHLRLFDESTLNKAHLFLREALKDICPNSNIEVFPDYKLRPRYKQGLRIVISENKTTLFDEII